jgi:hypothetical protein
MLFKDLAKRWNSLITGRLILDTEQGMRKIKSFSNKISLISKDSTLIYNFLKSIQAKADTFI